MRQLFIGAFLILLLIKFSAGAAEVIDPAQAKADPKDPILWYDVCPLGVEGKGWMETKAPFDRLPAKAEAMVRDRVWHWSRRSAGLAVRFITESPTVHARWTLTSEGLAMTHMPATGVSGIDLYVKHDGQWRWIGNGFPGAKGVEHRARLVSGLPAGKREFLLYLPLYNGVSSVEVGIPKERALLKADPRPADRQKPIVFYGTSITQGGCASRPGMVHTAILGRRFDRPVINLGFSGNGRMEPEMAQLLAELDAAVYVIECLSNMGAKDVEERTEPLVRIIRKARPKTPILLAEDPTCCHAFLLPSVSKGSIERRAQLRKAYDALVKAGVGDLHYLAGDKLYGEDGEATVDGEHATDLGFQRLADALQPALTAILRVEAKGK